MVPDHHAILRTILGPAAQQINQCRRAFNRSYRNVVHPTSPSKVAQMYDITELHFYINLS
jgi:hypothetical protein